MNISTRSQFLPACTLWRAACRSPLCIASMPATLLRVYDVDLLKLCLWLGRWLVVYVLRDKGLYDVIVVFLCAATTFSGF